MWDEASDDEEDGVPAGRRRLRSRCRCDEDDDDDLRSLPRSDDTPVSRKRSNAAQNKSASARIHNENYQTPNYAYVLYST